MMPVSKTGVFDHDPYYGFPLPKHRKSHETALEIYFYLHQKEYKCLTPYIGAKNMMEVICPKGHKWHGYPRKVAIPCNNCQECWEERGLTSAEKLNEVIVSKEGELLTTYTLSKDPISIRCADDHIFVTISGDVLSGKWCITCSGRDPEEAKKKFYSILESLGAKALTPYINSTTKVNILCKRNHIYDQVPASTNMGHKCRFCEGNAPELGEAKFIENMAAKGGTILGKYTNRYTGVPSLCDKQHPFLAIPASIARGCWCLKCVDLCPIQAKERFIASVTDQGGKVIGEYVTVHIKVSIQCRLEHLFNMTPGHISEGKWCPVCRKHCPIQAKINFEEAVRKLEGVVLGTYVNTATKVELKCKYDHIFSSKPNNVVNGKWCRLCGLRESKGEKKVREFLTSQNIEHDPEHIFDWMPLKRYDFYFVHNNRHYIVEFDGIQHFEHIEFFSPTEEHYTQRRLCDINKTVNALNQGYFLIRIAYSDIDNVDIIIDGCINDPYPEYRLFLSDPEKYQWLLDGIRPLIK